MAFRPKIVLELLKWRKQVNPHFKNIEISMEIINTAATKLEKHIVHEEEHQKHHEGGEQRDEHAIDEFDERTDDGDEITTRFNQRIDDQAGDGDIQEVIDVLVRNEPKNPVEQVLMIETSQSTIKEYDPIVLTLMFPDLYLFGRCGLDEKKKKESFQHQWNLKYPTASSCSIEDLLNIHCSKQWHSTF